MRSDALKPFVEALVSTIAERVVEGVVARLQDTQSSGNGADQPDEAMTVAQAANFCRCSESHLDNLRSRGGGPKFNRIGGRRVRYLRSDLLRWMRKNARDST